LSNKNSRIEKTSKTLVFGIQTFPIIQINELWIVSQLKQRKEKTMRDEAVNVGGRMVPPSEAGTQGATAADEYLHEQRTPTGGGGGGKPSCFPSSAQVLTPGGWRRIADIKSGEIVLARKGNGEFIRQHVIMRKDYAPCQIAYVVGSDGSELLRVTRSHTVLTDGGWRMVDHLRTGDRLIGTYDGRRLSLGTVERVIDSGLLEPVHNLIVSGSYNFVAQGCVSHSFTYFRVPRMVYSEIHYRLTRLVKRIIGRTELAPAKGTS